MSFEECLQGVCQELLLLPEDRQSLTKDAEIIRNFLMQRMQDFDENFKAAFCGLSLTGSYLDRLKIYLPDEFDLHIKLKMPFSITPCRDENRPGFVRLHVSKSTCHDIVRQHRVNRYRLQRWIRNIFIKAVGEGIQVEVGAREYFIQYPTYGRGAGVAHTIIAKQIGDESREIFFDFVPAFEFSPHQWPLKDKRHVEDVSWFVVPFGKKLRSSKERSNKYAFMVCAPHWERIKLHDKQNLKNSLRLMKALRNKNMLGRLSSYMLKSIYLEQIEQRPENFWENPMGVILIEMLGVLEKSLREDCLPFFLHKGFNHLDLLPKNLIGEYREKLHEILKRLRRYQQQSSVDFADVACLFIRQK